MVHTHTVVQRLVICAFAFSGRCCWLAFSTRSCPTISWPVYSIIFCGYKSCLIVQFFKGRSCIIKKQPSQVYYKLWSLANGFWNTFKKVTKLENEIKRQKIRTIRWSTMSKHLVKVGKKSSFFNRKRASEPGLGMGNHKPLPGGGRDDELE